LLPEAPVDRHFYVISQSDKTQRYHKHEAVMYDGSKIPNCHLTRNELKAQFKRTDICFRRRYKPVHIYFIDSLTLEIVLNDNTNSNYS